MTKKRTFSKALCQEFWSRDRVASRGWLEREIDSGGALPGQVEIVNKFVHGSPGHQVP